MTAIHRVKVNSKKVKRLALWGGGTFAIIFAVYLGVLYLQLRESFSKPIQFVPTRFFSDLTRLAAPTPRSIALETLKSLNYSFHESLTETGSEIRFQLHPPDYPLYLLPPEHPIERLFRGGTKGVDAAQMAVSLKLDGNKKDSIIRSVELGGQEVAEIFLEPDTIATLSNTGDATINKIRSVVSFDSIPAPVWKAVIAVEDPRFLEHMGLDPRGLLRAIWVDLKTRSLSQGGSTITLQLVKNLTERKGRNLFRKVNEIFLAPLLELTFEKEQILERYLNEVYLGHVGSLDVHGVAEGARHFFNKPLEDLNLAEMAFLAGVIRGPGFYSPYNHLNRAVERQRFVLKRMVESGAISEAEERAAARTPLRFAPPQNIANKAPYFSDFVKAELIKALKGQVAEADVAEASLRVYTTLDLRLAQAAQHSVTNGIEQLQKNLSIDPTKTPLQGALAAVDHRTGYIRALVGGKSYSHSTFNRILNMKRQVGSTFKPFVYLTALLKGHDSKGVPFSLGYPVYDGPWTLNYDKGRQSWSPRNYEKEFKEWITLREALAFSINTVAARVSHEVGIANIIKTAKELGIESDLPEVPSLGLGVAELSPIELLKAYSVIANHGVQDELTVIRAISHDDGTSFARFVYHPKTVLEPAAADLMIELLQSVVEFGTARATKSMGLDTAAAGKTGTTSNYRDAWFAGFSPHLTTVVWVGMDEAPKPEEVIVDKKKPKKKKVELTGAGSALPIWVQFMKDAALTEPQLAFPNNQSLVDVAIDRHTGKRASSDCPAEQTITEKFPTGLEPTETSCESSWPEASEETTSE